VASASMLMRHLSCMDVPSLAFMITCRKHDTASQQGACGLQQTSVAASQCSKGYNPSVVKGCGPGVVNGYGCCHHGSCRARIMHPTPSHKQSPSTACVKSWSAGNRLCNSHYDSGQTLLPYQDRTFSLHQELLAAKPRRCAQHGVVLVPVNARNVTAAIVTIPPSEVLLKLICVLNNPK